MADTEPWIQNSWSFWRSSSELSEASAGSCPPKALQLKQNWAPQEQTAVIDLSERQTRDLHETVPDLQRNMDLPFWLSCHSGRADFAQEGDNNAPAWRGTDTARPQPGAGHQASRTGGRQEKGKVKETETRQTSASDASESAERSEFSWPCSCSCRPAAAARRPQSESS